MNLLSDDTRRDPYPAYALIRERCPVYHDSAQDLWMILDYAGVKRALTDHESFGSTLPPSASRPTPDWLIFFDPPRHTKLRGIITRAFTPRVLTSLESRISELSRSLLDEALERNAPGGSGEMDLAAEFSVRLPMLVIAEMFGLPSADWPRFKRWNDVIVKFSYTVTSGDAAAAAAREFVALNAEMNYYLGYLLRQRRRSPGDDLLSRLAVAEVDGERLTQDELVAFFQLLLAGGTETTTDLINSAVLCFIEYPDQLARLRTAPELLPSAIEEVLRYRAPFAWTFRGTRRDVDVGGQVIPANRLVLAMIGSANRDPRVFPDPERFDVTRDPNPHVAFGHGIHFCLGALLSRMEGRIALSQFLERVPRFELASEDPWEPREALHVHGPSRVPIRFEVGAR